MGKTLIAIESDAPYLAVTWQVNNYCNFRCSYCNSGNWSGQNKNDGDLDKYLANLSVIIDKYTSEGYENFKFFFSGGEPTIWENFIPICEWLRKTLPKSTIAVNTNLSRSLSWWENHHHLFDDIVASFHVEFANKDAYEENSIFLCDKVNYLSSKMLMHDERFWEVVNYGNHLKTVMPNYFIEWTPLFDEMSVNAGPWRYSDPAKSAFLGTHSVEMQFTAPKPQNDSNAKSTNVYDDGSREPTNSNEIITRRQNYFKGWRCSVGDSIFISPVGDVSLASCGQGDQIGHILNDISEVGPSTIICNKEHCHCGTDIIIPKAL